MNSFENDSYLRRIRLTEPDVAASDAKYILECFERGWNLSRGKYVKKFEEEMAAYLGADWAVAVSSGTAALHIALILAGVRGGDEVIVPSLTYIATVNSILYLNAIPAFMDSDSMTLGIDSLKLEEFLNKQCISQGKIIRNRDSGRIIKAIVAVHLYGMSCDIEKIMELGNHYGIPVIEDACQALGSSSKGRFLGTFGRFGCFSFNENKLITTGGGGILSGSFKDTDSLLRARSIISQGVIEGARFCYNEMGYNYIMGNLQAAFGLAQLEKLDCIITRKKEIGENYLKFLEKITEYKIIPRTMNKEWNNWVFPLVVREEFSEKTRNDLICLFEDQNIETRPFFKPAHTLQFCRYFPCFRVDMADSLSNHGIILPNFSGMTQDDQERVFQTLSKCSGK